MKLDKINLQQSSFGRSIVITIVLFLIIICSHLNIFSNAFVMDDFDYIVDWPLIQDLSNIPQFFINYTPHPGQEGIYSPLKTLFHALNYHFFKANPLGYHIVSLLVHLVSAFFVFLIIDLLTKKGTLAFLGAIFFVLHPVHVEAITYMTASVDMIGIMFLFIAFYFYILFDQLQKRGVLNYILALMFSLLAVFTHELAVSIPLLFLWYNVCFKRQKEKIGRSLLKVLPVFGIVLFYVIAKYLVLGGITRNTYLYDSFYLTMLVSIKAVAKYIYICLFPLVLTHNHVISEGISSFGHMDFDQYAVLSQSLLDGQVIISLLVIGGAIYLGWKSFKIKPLISFCIGWFFISLLPGLNIIPSGVYFAERYLYPGMLGFVLLLSIALEYLIKQERVFKNIPFRTIGYVLLVGLICFYSARTWVRNAEWHDEVVFFESAVRANPNSALMRNDMGIIYTEYGLIEKAILSFEKAMEIQDDNPEIYFSAAEAYIQNKNYTKTISMLEKAVELDHDYAEAYYNLATTYAFLKNSEKAIQYLKLSMDSYQKDGRNLEATKLLKSFFDHFGGAPQQ